MTYFRVLLLICLMLTPAWANTPLGSANLIADGNMEKVGVGDWVSEIGVITKETTAPYRGMRNIKIEIDTGDAYANVYQTPLTIGKKYRFSGKYKTDGTANAQIKYNAGGFTLTPSSPIVWTNFDLVVDAEYQYAVIQTVGLPGDYAEFDDIRVVEYKGKQQGSASVVVDGNMEKVGVGDWTATNNPTITKEITDPKRGTRNIKIAYNGSNLPSVYQSILTAGKTYRYTGWARSDGTWLPKIYVGVYLECATISGDWEYFDFTNTPTGPLFYLGNNIMGAGYSEWDDIRVEEVL